MRSVIVAALHNPNGELFHHLKAIRDELKGLFSQAIVSVTNSTFKKQQSFVSWLKNDDFFNVLVNSTNISIGESYLALYHKAVGFCQPGQILHLCSLDRVAFALQSEYREAFINDMRLTCQTPIVFQRSKKAWVTHPTNYRELEQLVTKVGKILFGKELEFAWCHLVIKVEQLQRILPLLINRDLSIIAEMILLLINDINTKQVDWLAWEDPYIFSCNLKYIKNCKEKSKGEVRKRLSYVIPMLQLFLNKNNSKKQNMVNSA